MYTERLNTLVKAYKVAEKNNRLYEESQRSIADVNNKLAYINGLSGSLQLLESLIVEQENQWQDAVLRFLEAEIMQDLAFVYPSDGYSVTLSSRVLRGKIHIEASVRSYFTNEMLGDISDTQGRLFQQIVSFAALVGVMKILGVNTVYVDEAFSGAAKANVTKVNKLLSSISERGYNIILIAQDSTMSESISANTLLLSRSLDNKTSVLQIVEGGSVDE